MNQMSQMSQDPVVQDYRERIARLDLAVLEALNARVDLVRRLKAHKDAQGFPFHDPAQEERLLDSLCRANLGPLSEQGLREIFGLILAWAKREAAGQGQARGGRAGPSARRQGRAKREAAKQGRGQGGMRTGRDEDGEG